MTRSHSTAESTQPNRQRRAFSQSMLGLALGGWGLVRPAVAGSPPPVDHIAAALRALGSKAGARPEASPLVHLTLPRLIEDGAVVPVSVSAELPDAREIYILTDMNPSPIAAQFRVGPGVAPRILVRIKLADSGRVYGAVRTADGLYWTTKVAAVTVGGCS